MGPMTLFGLWAILSTCLADKEPERHSLYYVYTVLSQQPDPASGIYEFTAMGLLDDRKIEYYNSVGKVKIPQQDWMKAKLPASYWENGTKLLKSKEQWFKVNINILMKRMRHNTSDIHSLMWRHGCEAFKLANGSLQFVKGVDEYSYDGRDLLFNASMPWVESVSDAVQTTVKWEEKECVEWLDKFLKYGASELAETLKHYPPEVHLFAKNGRPYGRYLLTCLATGFYPKDIKISILMNDWPEKDGHQDDVLPNGDGTHQIRLSYIAVKEKIHMYRCKVHHRTLDQPIIAEWETGEEFVDEVPGSGPPIGPIAGVLVVLLLIGSGVGIIIFAKKMFCFDIAETDAPPPSPVAPVPEETAPLNGSPVVAFKNEGLPGEEPSAVVKTGRGSSDRSKRSSDGSPVNLQGANGNA